MKVIRTIVITIVLKKGRANMDRGPPGYWNSILYTPTSFL